MKKFMFLRSKSVWAGLAVLLGIANPAIAAVLHVPAHYPTIQAAVDAASSGNGVRDEIKIAPGVYMEQVLITNRSLELSAPGAALRARPGMGQTTLHYDFGDVALFRGHNVRGLANRA